MVVFLIMTGLHGYCLFSMTDNNFFFVTASRLGRRPKRMKDPASRDKPTTNLPIAPYPSSSDSNKARLQELQGFLQQGGSLKPEMMEAFLSAAQVSFREHQRNHQNTNSMSNMNNNPVKLPGQRQANDSGYSSLSSPSSNKSSSPPEDNRQINGVDVENNIEDNKAAFNMDPSVLNMCIPQSSRISSVDIKSEPTEHLSSCSKSGAHNPLMDFSPQDLGDVFNQNELHDLQEESFNRDFDQGFSPGDGNFSMLYTEQTDEGMTIPSAIEETFEDNTFSIDIEKIMLEVVKKPSEIRRRLIDQVTEEVVAAHFKTCKPTYQNVREANLRIEKLKASNMLVRY